MADLMGKYSHNLVRAELGDECIEEYDPLFLSVAGEIGVGLGAAFGGIHHVDVFQLEPRLLREGFDSRTQFALLKGLLLVEQRDDQL